MILGKRRTSSLVMFIILQLFLSMIVFPNVTSDLSDPKSLLNHQGIRIESNNEFDNNHGVSSGSGTQNDPYIIENLSIDATMDGGMWIRDTTMHFIIRNCKIFNGSNESYQSSTWGLYFSNAKNGIIENNRIYSCYSGIYMKDSVNMKIINNTIYNNYYSGIKIEDSDDLEIYDNIIYNNSEDGVYFWGTDSYFYNNSISENSELGLYINSHKCFVFNNTIYNNSKGVYISGSSPLEFFNNTINNNLINFGISEDSNVNHHIYENNTINGKPIIVWCSQANKIVPSNAGYIGLINCFNIIIRNLTITNNRQGLLLINTDKCKIYNNSFFNGSFGAFFDYSDNNIIYNNTFSNNSEHGFELENCNGNSIYNNNFSYNSEYGLYFDRSTNTVNNNFIHHNQRIGLYISNSDNNVLTNNSIYDNHQNFRVNTKYTNNIDTTNTVDGKPIYYLVSQTSKSIPTDAGYVGLVDCINITVRDLHLQNNYQGILLYSSDYCQIYNNSIYNTTDGIYLEGSTENTIYNNTLANASTAISLGKGNLRNLVKFNNVNNSGNGIRIGGDWTTHSYYNKVCNNIVTNNTGTAISLSFYGRYNEVFNNTICYNQIGVNLWRVSQNHIFNNRIYNHSKHGIHIELDSNYNYIYNNSIFNNNYSGIYIERSEKCVFYNNTIYNNPYNLMINTRDYQNYVSYYNHNFAENNTVDGKTVYYWHDVVNGTIPLDAGFVGLYNCDNITVRNLNLSNNSHGVLLVDTNNCLIENNNISNCYNGKFALRSSYNRFMNNSINNSDNNGIYNYDSSFNEVLTNNISNRGLGFGIYISKYSQYTSIFHNTIKYCERGIGYWDANYAKIINNTVSNCSDGGIRPVISGHGVLQNNTVFNCYYGIQIYDCRNLTLYNNTIFKNTYNFGIEGDYIGEFEHTIPINNTVDGKPIYYWRGKSNQTIPFDAGYVGIIECYNVTAKNLVLRNNYQGILDACSINSSITNNTLEKNYYGIFVAASTGIKFFNNAIKSNNLSGINIEKSDYNSLYNNSFNNNYYGITTYYSDENLFYNNSISNSSYFGIYLRKSYENLFYNNIIINTNNTKIQNQDPGRNNYWNISRTLGTNIIGGPYLGGNYWSDYNGIDNDGDGLGNTRLPLGNGDKLPLCYVKLDISPPIIIDVSAGLPITGDHYNITVNATDFSGVVNINISYWFDLGTKINSTMVQQSGDKINGLYSVEVPVPINAENLYFIVRSNDTKGYSIITKGFWKSVIDSREPNIGTDTTHSNGYTGDFITFSIICTDNIGVKTGYVEFWNGSGAHQNMTMVRSGNLFTYTPAFPVLINSTDNWYYFFSFRDNSSMSGAGLWNSTSTKTIQILDNDKPTFGNNSTPLSTYTGKQLTFAIICDDNIKVEAGWVYYKYQGLGTYQKFQLNESLNNYTKTISVNHTINPIKYYFSFKDSSNNWNNGTISQISILDHIEPNIGYNHTSKIAYTGDPHTFYIKCTDNVAIGSAWIYYKYGSGQFKQESMSFSVSNYSKTITIKDTIEPMYYYSSFKDTSNNWNNSSISRIDIFDNDKPRLIQDLSDSNAYANQTYKFSILASDNIEPISANVEYYFGDTGQHQFRDMVKDGNYFNCFINIPNSLEKLHYRFYINDSNPLNSNLTVYFETDVLDREKPIAISGRGDFTTTTGEDFEIYAQFLDNIEINSVTIYYRRTGLWSDTIMSTKVNGRYSITNAEMQIETSQDISSWEYYIYTEDSSGNFEYYGSQSNPFMIKVLDNDAPTANAGENIIGEIGKIVTFDASGSIDNIGIINYTWTIKINNKVLFLYGKVVTYKFENTGEYSVILNVTDAADYWDKDIIDVSIIIPIGTKIELIFPHDMAILPGPELKLTWRTMNLNNVSLSYDVYMGTSPNPQKFRNRIKNAELNVIIPKRDVNYYWKVQVWINDEPGPISEIWSFQVAHEVADFGVELIVQKTEFIHYQGDFISIMVSVKNTQERHHDWIELEVNKNDLPHGLMISKDSLYIGPGEEQNIFLNLTVNDLKDIGDYLINLTARSKGALNYSLAIFDSVHIKLTVLIRQSDIDNDNYPDDMDVFPDNPTEWNDTDGDNYGDNTDAFPNNPTEWNDTDGDNYGDNMDFYPDDPAKWQKEEDKKEPSEKDDLTWIMVSSAIVIILIIVILLLFLFAKRKKKIKVEKEPQPEIIKEQEIQQQIIQQSQQKSCPTCGLMLKYYSQNDKYYCDYCKKYE